MLADGTVKSHVHVSTGSAILVQHSAFTDTNESWQAYAFAQFGAMDVKALFAFLFSNRMQQLYVGGRQPAARTAVYVNAAALTHLHVAVIIAPRPASAGHVVFKPHHAPASSGTFDHHALNKLLVST